MQMLILAIWVCIACAGHGRRVQTLIQGETKIVDALPGVESLADVHQSNKQARSEGVANPLKALTLLLTGNGAAAFMFAATPRHLTTGSFAHRHEMARLSSKPKATAGTQELPTVVVGGGIVGLTAAYFLARKGRPVTIVEKCAVACHSSGKAGGFLTDGDSGWHGPPIDKLAKHSFALHEELANELGAEKIGYRKVRCVGASPPGAYTEHPTPEWLAEGFEMDMGDPRKMAQVTPYKFMDELLAQVKSQGADVVIAKVTGVDMEDGTVSAVNVEQDGKQQKILCSAVILAMGPWARDASAWFPDSVLPRSTVSSRYSSVIWDDTQVGQDATMVFVSGPSKVEIYARTNEAYANGCPTTVPLPDDPLDIVPPEEDIQNIIDETASAVERLKHADVIRSTACFLPTSDDGNPVIGHVPNTKNAIISCAGGCWGILNGPAMGQAAADLVVGDAPAIDLTPFDPGRFDLSKLSATLEKMGVSPKLTMLVAQNPQLLGMIEQNPQVQDQLLSMLENQAFA